MFEPYTPTLTPVINFDMAESNQLYYVKIYVRSSVKLLEEIKLLLERNPNRERLFRRTIFGCWLDISSHDNDNHLMHYVLQHQDSNPILELYATSSETKESWFIASINFINGLVDEDMNVSQDDGVGVVSLLLDGGDGVLDLKGGAKNLDTEKAKQPTMAEIFAEILALRKEVALVKGDVERITKLERLVNQIVVNQGKGGSSNDLMSSCSPADIDNGKVACAGTGFDNFDGKNDIPNDNQNVVNQGFGSFANDPMELQSSCSRTDMDNGKVACSGMGIDKVDGMNDIPNLNHNCVNQGKGGSANDPMSTCSLTDIDNGEVTCDGMVIDKADGKNEYTYSQRTPSTLDVLIKAMDCANDNPRIDVLQHDNDVDRFIVELNHHLTVDIHVEPVHVYDFADDYMSVLNDEEHEEEHEAKYSLDEMKLIDEEAKLIVKDPLVKQHVDAFIDEQEDKTTVLQENAKDVSGALKIRSINELMTLEVFVEVYFPVNEPKKHWCLAELHISSGVVTFYDTLESKGISVESYEIKYMFPKVVEQADLYGDCGVWLSLDGGSITSGPAIMTMPSHYFLKLLGFNNHDLPIVEASTGHIIGHTVQVYMENSQSFKNVTIQGNVSSFFVGAYKESLILAAYPNHSLHYAG
ncbi:phospholipase-like protein [Tanacetum coccineum]